MRAVACAVVGVVAFTLTAGTAVATTGHAMTISGTVTTPTHYTAAEVALLPQNTYPGHVTGASLLDIVTKAAPVLPPGKNTALRVTLTVTGRHHQRSTFALGELDPNFGNHPAVLTTNHHTIDLTVPGDRGHSRAVQD
ncbi:hypothetical protein ACFQ1S_22865, partial [Kibdelosporangium lantanae]